MLQVGSRVMTRTAPHWRGEVRFVHPEHAGLVHVEVRRDDGGHQTVLALDLQPEVVADSAWDLVAANVFGSHADFAVATTVHKVLNAANNTVSTLRASRTIFKPYQYKPLVKFLESDARRILVADEVGLGKTIEAGHVLLEMSGRKQLRSALVVCPKSLRSNWQAELAHRFHFSFKTYESPRDLAADIRHAHAGGRQGLLGVVNYEKCKSDRVLEALAETGFVFDMVICDESHRLRNRGTHLYAGMEKVLGHAGAALFLTATPVMLGEEDLFNQVRLLDPDRFPNFEVFLNALALNRPFVRALRDLNAGVPLAAVARALGASEVRTSVTIGEEFRTVETTSVAEALATDPLYVRAMGLMAEPDGPASLATRARVQADLADLNSLSHLYTRTRKRDVDTDGTGTTRRVRRLRVTLSDSERDAYDAVADSYGGLEVVTRKRQIASSIPAYLTPRDDLKAGFFPTGAPDAKYDRFKEIVADVHARGAKAVVFSTFIDTLLYLKARLQAEGVRTAVIHGGVKDRDREIARFEDPNGPHVLLSSEVGAVGLNLQFADTVVNYDLPWNPMVVEQRIGRVDRIGQTSPVVRVYSFTVADTIEERIYDRLLERIGVFEATLGDVEAILEDTKAFERLEHDLYSDRLTVEEQNARIDAVALAVENQRVVLEDIEARLADAVVNDAHFQSEIDRIVSDRRYLTEEEIRGLVEGFLRSHLPSCSLADLAGGMCEVLTTGRSLDGLVDAVEAHKDDADLNPELDVLFRRFEVNTRGKARRTLTFDRAVAYADRQTEYVQAYHPLVNAAANALSADGLHLNKAFRIGLDRAHLVGEEGPLVAPGDYLLAVYRIALDKQTAYGPRRAEYLLASLVDLNGDDGPVLLSDVTAGRVFGVAQAHAAPLPRPEVFDEGMVAAVRSPVAIKTLTAQARLSTDEGVRLASSALRRRAQLVQYYENQLLRRRDLLAAGRGIEAVLRSEIAEFERQLAAVEDDAAAPSVVPSNDVVSVNHLQVF